MAILRSIYLKGASQKLGGVVLYQAQGRTLARELAPSVSNPRTPSQMEQRVKLANVVAFYRANRLWMKGAFEDKKQSESDYNAFVSANLATSQVATSRSEANAGAAVVAPYKITSGSLPSVEQYVQGTAIVSNLYVGSLSITPSTTVGALSQALISNNGGIREGMQLSLIINIQQSSEASMIPYIVVRAYECLMNSTSTELLTKYFPGSIIGVSAAANPTLQFNYSSIGVGAAAFILSETQGGSTRVSTQSLVMFGSSSIYQQYTSAQALAAAIISYGEGADTFLSSNSAYGNEFVPVANSIQSIGYDGRTFIAGQTIATELPANVELVLNMASPIGAGQTLSSSVHRVGEDTIFASAVELDSEDNRIVNLTITPALSPDVYREYMIELTIDDKLTTFIFAVNGGDIS